MKRNILLVANSSGDANAIVADAVTRTGRGLRHADNSRRAFELLMAGLDDIDLIIIDLDPGMHSISVLEALGCCDTCPPIIVVTGLEELEMTAIAHRHGATSCIGKPFSVAELASLIEEVCPSTARPCTMSCDLWGHPRNCAGECRHPRQHKEVRPLART
jgi:DNA-binding response OmpR family regulator